MKNDEALIEEDNLGSLLQRMEGDKRFEGSIGLIEALRECFHELRLGREDEERLREALSLMIRVHWDETRMSDEPYINHPIEVTQFLLGLGIKDPDVLSAALLHDSMENGLDKLCDISGYFYLPGDKNGHNLRTVSKHCLEPRIGERATGFVNSMTLKEANTADPEERRRHYREECEKLMDDPYVVLIKIGDLFMNRADNDEALPHEKRIQQTAKYLPVWKMMFERIKDTDIVRIIGHAKRAVLKAEIMEVIYDSETFLKKHQN